MFKKSGGRTTPWGRLVHALRVGDVRLLLIPILWVIATSDVRPALAQSIKGDVTGVVANGFARLVFTLGENVDSQVRVANNIVIVNFNRPVEIKVDRISAMLAGYATAARRDPDGKAVRIALSRKVTVNSMAAGERLFVDFLPEGWAGMAPGLPREVVEELARRAIEAEKKIRLQQELAREVKPIRVRVATQPTFTRYVFELPQQVGVAADSRKEKLLLTFDVSLKFDLADAKAALPSTIQSIDSQTDQDSTSVRFAFNGKVDIRTFREDDSYVVDVSSADSRTLLQEQSTRSDDQAGFAANLILPRLAPTADLEPPQTVAPETPNPESKPAAVAIKPQARTLYNPSPEKVPSRNVESLEGALAQPDSKAIEERAAEIPPRRSVPEKIGTAPPTAVPPTTGQPLDQTNPPSVAERSGVPFVRLPELQSVEPSVPASTAVSEAGLPSEQNSVVTAVLAVKGDRLTDRKSVV
jgi:hypothetical protein